MILVSSLAMAAVLAEQPERVPPAPPTVVIVPSPEPQRPPAPLPNPTAQARELALGLLRPVTIFDSEARNMLLNQIRSPVSSAACDYSNAECRRIAEEIAAREAPQMAADMRDALSRVLGALFDRTMTAEQIAASSGFLESDAGRALIGSFVSINAQTFAGIESPFSFARVRRDELAAEFARRTSHLPRTPRTAIPTSPAPAPVPPAPPATPKPPRG